MLRAASWLTLAALSACAPPDAPPPDPAPAACTADAPIGVTISEGGRRTVALDLPEAVTGWSVTDGGPFTATALDAQHLALRAPWELAGDFTVQLALQCDGRTGTLAVPVTLRRLQWSALPKWTEGVDGPLAREYGAFWVDGQNPGRARLYGGFVYRPKQFTPATDAWTLDLATGQWARASAAGTPPAVTGGRVAARPGSADALYLGGITLTSGTPYVLARLSSAGDALTWSDTAASGGRGDYQPGFFWDPKRERYLSLCGANDAIGWHCELRALAADLSGWTPIATAGAAPEGRNGHFYVYDAETDRVILFGGDSNGTTLGDTWALELGESPPRWVALGNDPLLRRRNGAWVLDPVSHRLVMWGGTQDGLTAVDGLWVLSLDRGQERWLHPTALDAPVNRASAVAVYDAARERMVAGLGNSNQGVYADLYALQL